MELEDLRKMQAPFSVKSIHDGHVAVVVGFTQQNPHLAGAPIPIGMYATVYFDGGGWLLVSDLLKHFEIVQPS